MSLIPQEGTDVPCYRVAQTHHDGILGGVDKLIELVWLEASEQADVRIIGDEAGLPGRASAERPLVRRYRCHRACVADRVANFQARMSSVRVRRRVRLEARAAFQCECESSPRGDGAVRILDANVRNYRAAVRVRGDWKGGGELMIEINHVALPTCIDNRVSQPQEKSVTRVA